MSDNLDYQNKSSWLDRFAAQNWARDQSFVGFYRSAPVNWTISTHKLVNTRSGELPNFCRPGNGKQKDPSRGRVLEYYRVIGKPYWLQGGTTPEERA